MGEIPPMRKFLQERKELTGDKETKGCDTVTEKVRSAIRGLEPLLFPSLITGQSTEPTIEHYRQVDWSLPYNSLPTKAQELIALIVENCHPSTLQRVLLIARQRITRDFELWSLQRDVEETLQIGDKIYRKRMRRRNADLIV